MNWSIVVGKNKGVLIHMVKFLIMDVDGTLTDGKIYMSDTGEMMKVFNIKDGYGIHDILIPEGIIPVIITGRSSKILFNRCRELGITEVHQGVANKIEKLKEIVAKLSLRHDSLDGLNQHTADLSTVAYIGDDINDFSCMEVIKAEGGKVGCPADAAEKILMISDYISPHNGGEGAVRDFIEWLVEEQ